MEQKEVKSFLKEAKEAIKNKENDKALRLCRSVLKIDPENYLALVIYGAALQESKSKSEAPSAYRKAISISPDQILAWQGLASYYEKEKLENAATELLSIYKHLILLEKEEIKWIEIFKKVDRTIQYVKSSETIKEFASLTYIEIPKKLSMLLCSLIKYFKGLKKVPDSLLNIYEEVLLSKIQEKGEDVLDCMQTYMNILNQRKCFEQIIMEEDKFMDDEKMYDKNILELICKAYCFVSWKQNLSIKKDRIEKYCSSLLNVNVDSLYGQITKGILSYEEDNFIECRNVLHKVLEIDNRNWIVHYYLSKVQILLHCFKCAIANVTRAQDLCPTDVDAEMKNSLLHLHLEAMSRSEDVENCNRCLDLCETLSPVEQKKTSVIRCTIHAAITLNKWDLVEKKLDEFTSLESNKNSSQASFLRSLYLFRAENFCDAVDLLRAEICGKEEENEYALHWILLGELYWKQTKTDDGFNCFLRAAKLTSYVYTVFLYLGHYYREIDSDFNKARRCYQKAFQLNPRSEEVGIALSQTYRALKMMDDNFKLLNEVASSYDDNWAWVRLGFHYIQTNEPETAIKCLRSCVRKNPNDSYSWELLGDACFMRGSFVAASKCYQKCVDFDESSFHANLHLAVTKKYLGLHEECISTLRDLLKKYPDSIPASIALAEACSAYVPELCNKQMFGWVRDLCEETVAALSKILLQTNKLICVWKLLAHTCVLVAQLPSIHSYLELPSTLSKLTSNSQTDETDATETYFKQSLIDMALQFYEITIHLSKHKQMALNFLWYDVAFCHNLKASLTKTETDRAAARRLAMSAAKKSVTSNPKRWENWNLLGVIALSKEINDVQLAQHCFINAVRLEANSALAWNNLGVLYLQFDDVLLANEVFQVAQKVDPKYLRSWIGQAMIAERVGHDETVDLFYHTTVLGYHQESAKGFAEWICKIFKEWDVYKEKSHCYYIVEKMYGLQVAVTVLSWYTVHNPEDISAANMLAVLLELCSLNRTATSLLEGSLSHAAGEECDVICSNLGRQLRKLGQHKKAIDRLKQIKEVDFSTSCNLALTLFLDGQIERALEEYVTALHWLAPDDGWKAQVMVAMAALEYLNNEKKKAQAILLECLQLKPIPVYGLFAACAFGILNKDLVLSKLVLQELKSFERNEEYIKHIAFFKSYYQVFQRNFKSAISVMSTFVHNYPGNASLWLSLCFLLQQLIFLSKQEYMEYCMATAHHARCSITLGRGNIDISKISSVASLSYLLAGKIEDCLRNSRRAVFMHPDVAENWAVLISAKLCKEPDYSAKDLIQFVREKLICSKELSNWLLNIFNLKDFVAYFSKTNS